MAAAPRPIEFKGTTLTVVLAQLSTADLDTLSASLEAQLGAQPDFFCGEPLVMDCSGVEAGGIDWNRLSALVRRYGLNPLAVRNLEPGARDAAEQAGWRVLEAGAPVAPVRPLAVPEPEPVAPAAEAPAPGALLIDKPLRSGQQIYARGGDLVVLAMVSAGAEVIADGSIHVYAPLRGRALAGARGDENARIFTTSLEAELVSIAGVWRTFEGGIPETCLRRPAQIRLLHEGDTAVLSIEPLSID